MNKIIQNLSILVICREGPNRLPPVFSLLLVLMKMCKEVILLTTALPKETKEKLESNGILVKELGSNIIDKHKSLTQKAKEIKRFRKAVNDELKHFPDKMPVWIASGDTAIALGRNIKNYNYILQLHELYDKFQFHRHLLKWYARNAKVVVVPEICRAAIFKLWFNLSTMPSVLPNKPYPLTVAAKNGLVEHRENLKKLESIAGKKLLLYQARMLRMDVIDIARAVKKLGNQFVLGIFGDIRDQKMVKRVYSEYPELVHFEYISAPDHLELTKHAYIGILLYNYESLNNIFCAPNKIWEYSGLGLPMLCNNLPLVNTQFRNFVSGETFEEGDIDSIVKAVKKIDENYEIYSEGSTKLFNSVDFKSIVLNILTKLGRRHL